MTNNKKAKLTYYEREKIELYSRLRYSKRAIARKLRRNHSIIVRETNRNIKNGQVWYNAKLAQMLSDQRIRKRNTIRKLDKDEQLRQYVINRITKDEWSPEQIAGVLKNHPPNQLQGKYINHESIYLYIYNSSSKYLYKSLRRKKVARRQARYSRKYRSKTKILERVSIHNRSQDINERVYYGDWESDTMIFSKQKECLSVQHERKSLLVRIHKVKNKSSEETKEAIRSSLETIPQSWRQSITFDNGSEGAKHMNIRDEYEMDTYFCDPYSSWQKGGVENTNGLLRQYLPSKINMSTITERNIYKIQEKLNNRPRKKLKYLTPNQIFNQQGGALLN